MVKKRCDKCMGKGTQIVAPHTHLAYFEFCDECGGRGVVELVEENRKTPPHEKGVVGDRRAEPHDYSI